MQKKYSYKSIISFVLIVSIILMPLSFLPRKVEAQSLGGYTSGLSGAILALPQCGAGKLVGSGIKSLFSGIGSLFSSSGSAEIIGDPSSNQSVLNQQWQIDHPTTLPFFDSGKTLNNTVDSAASQID